MLHTAIAHSILQIQGNVCIYCVAVLLGKANNDIYVIEAVSCKILRIKSFILRRQKSMKEGWYLSIVQIEFIGL
jgi:hypothetical protein